ncbi:MAG: hypothetical protein C4534_05645 [Gaiellales bacterium]|nr:MAG: hypothetical protein C4534_05645 [Gaiellales bacterium]
MTAVYAKYNDSRKPEYRLVTTVEEGGGLFSLKRAATDAAAGFLDSLFEKHRLLVAAGFPLEPLEPGAHAGGVRFDYLEGGSLDGRAFAAVRAGDAGSLREVFREYGELVGRVPMAAGDAGGGFEEFLGDGFSGATAGMGLLAVGCLDLILENIYEDGGGFRLIDYEWTFSFPLPRDLVLARTVMNTYYKYRAYGINRLLPAAELFGLLGVDGTGTEGLMRLEWGFQRAVNKQVQPFDGFRDLYEKVLFEPYEGGAPLAELRAAFDEQAGRLARAEEELGHARRMLADRDAEIGSMRASKFWKMRELYLSVRGLPSRLRR